MTETIKDYKKRIISYVENRDPLEMQGEFIEILEKTLQSISPEVLSLRPAPEKWSISEIVAHLADDELVGAYRIRMILSAPGTDIQAFEQAEWAVRGKYSEIPVSQSLALFAQLRSSNLALFSFLTADQWDYYGIHAERGKESIREIAMYYAGHDINHLKQIEGILEGREA